MPHLLVSAMQRARESISEPWHSLLLARRKSLRSLRSSSPFATRNRERYKVQSAQGPWLSHEFRPDLPHIQHRCLEIKGEGWLHPTVHLERALTTTPTRNLTNIRSKGRRSITPNPITPAMFRLLEQLLGCQGKNSIDFVRAY